MSHHPPGSDSGRAGFLSLPGGRGAPAAVALAFWLLSLGLAGTARSASLSLDSDPALEECTIAVLSGSATTDGRPLLWKNRDSSSSDNEVVYFEDGLYRYLALVSAGETDKAWIGVNEVGFGVLNSLSYNIPDTYSGGITNGALMKLALQKCSSVEDFQDLLIETNETGRENPANLAVIDAQGGASVFEVGNFSFVRFDADNPADGPDGFLVRANFSLSADTTYYDTWRYRRALHLITRAVSGGGARAADLFRTARDLGTAEVDPYPLPCRKPPPGYPDAVEYVDAHDTINRRLTVATGVIRGVLPGAEDPLLSTFYILLGQPVVSPAIALWVAAGPTPPQVDGEVTAPLCDLTQSRMLTCYDYPYNGMLLNTRRLVQPMGSRPAYLSLVEKIEHEWMPRIERNLQRWREDGVDPPKMAAVEHEAAASIYQTYLGNTTTPAFAPPALALRCLPNPSRGETEISLGRAGEPADGAEEMSLEAGAFRDWAVEILDPSGRRMALLRGPESWDATGGAARLRWDGRDARGRPVPSGIYYCRPTRPPGAAITPLTVIR